MPIELEKNTATSYFRIYKNPQGFSAVIKFNRRDRMVFGQILSLPVSLPEKESSLKEFVSIFDTQYGGKAILTIAPELSLLLEPILLKPSASQFTARYITINDITDAITYISTSKTHVRTQLAKFASNEYQFLTKDQLKECPDTLFKFKIENASFITPEKIEQELYSATAEAEKLDNPFVEHYAIQSAGKIIACVMVALHGGYGYISDYIVASALHNQGIGQTLLLKAFEKVHERCPNGIWIIAGGDGTKANGEHLYKDVFPTQDLNEAQEKLGFYFRFNAPGAELINISDKNLSAAPPQRPKGQQVR